MAVRFVGCVLSLFPVFSEPAGHNGPCCRLGCRGGFTLDGVVFVAVVALVVFLCPAGIGVFLTSYGGVGVKLFGTFAFLDSLVLAASVALARGFRETGVNNGTLKKASFQLKPKLDIEESLITSVSKLIEKHASKYGIHEMMDVGTRKRLKEFDETAPVTLNVRMSQDMLDEFKAQLKKKAFSNKSGFYSPASLQTWR